MVLGSRLTLPAMSAGRHSLNIVRSRVWTLGKEPNLGNRSQTLPIREGRGVRGCRGIRAMKAEVAEPVELVGEKEMSMMRN